MLSPEEARVLGSLVEKAMTTPDYYPLTLNALLAACNQKSNRNPVLLFSASTVEEALRSLDSKGLIGITRSSGGRTMKYTHKVESALNIDSEQAALLAVMLLRGPQTVGELRTRTERYAEMAVDQTLEDLINRDEALVQRMAKGPGQKEARFRTLLVEPPIEPPAHTLGTQGSSDRIEDRVARLELLMEKVLAAIGDDLTGDQPASDGDAPPNHIEPDPNVGQW